MTLPGILFGILLALVGIFILWQFHPSKIFSTTTITGGDTSAQIWAPDFLKDNLLPRLSGWSHDWFGGFPAFTFYMVIPHLFATLLSYLINDNVAFKLVTIGGTLLIPYGAYFMGKLSGIKRPAPVLMAVFSLVFLYDDNHSIWGGNVFGTLAGEFAESWGLAFCLFYFGFLLRSLQTGRGRVWAGVFLALSAVCHPIAGMFAAAGTLFVALLNPKWKALRWIAAIFGLGTMLSSFWALPFLLRLEYSTTIGWRKSVNYAEIIFRGDWWWLMLLAFAGVILSFVYNLKAGKMLALSAVAWAAIFRFFYTGDFFVNRFLPLYYLSVVLLAGLAVGLLINKMASLRLVKRELKPDQILVIKSFSLTVFAAGIFLVILKYLPGLNAGENLTKWILQNDSAAAESFYNQLVNLAWIGMGGAALALLVVYLPVVADNAGALYRYLYRYSVGKFNRQPRERLKLGRRFAGISMVAAVFLSATAVFYSIGIQHRAIGWNDGGRFGVHIPGLQPVLTTKAPASLAPAWANWNYSGYENKTEIAQGPGWWEYSGIMETMSGIGAEHGCGRALWEYQNERMTSYGSSFSRNLFAYWTNGCITAMDGLYSESSATSPFYYISLSGVSEETSQIIRGREYPSRASGSTSAFAEGIEHLKLLGVKYYIVSSLDFVEAANAHPDLELLAVFPEDEARIQHLFEEWEYYPHSIYEVKGSDTIVPLQYEPVIVGGGNWLDKTNEWWLDSSRRDVVLLASGLDSYQRASFNLNPKVPDIVVKRKELEPVQVSNVEIQDQKISFNVDKTGVPVLLKVSYFPNWKVRGASGPYRASPNWMVVVPTQNEVVLNYGWTPVEYLSYGLSGLGIISAIGIYIWDRRRRQI